MEDQIQHTDGLSLFHNIDRMEESKTQLHSLIERLDRDTHLDEVESLVSGMGGMLGNVFQKNFVMQREMKALLESAKNGLLTNEQMVEAFNVEMKRGVYLTNIVGALKMQIENLFNAIVNSADDDGDEGEGMIDKVTDNVNMLWKSVNSLTTIIDSTPKTLESNIQRINHELIAPLRQQQLHDHSKSKSLSRSDDPEEFTEKLGQMKQVLEKRKEMKLHSPAPAKNGNINKGFGGNNPTTNQPGVHQQSNYGGNNFVASAKGYQNVGESGMNTPNSVDSMRSQGSAFNAGPSGQSNRNFNNNNQSGRQTGGSGPQMAPGQSFRNGSTNEISDNRSGPSRQGAEFNGPGSSAGSVPSTNGRITNDSAILPGQSAPDRSKSANNDNSSVKSTSSTKYNSGNNGAVVGSGGNIMNDKGLDFSDNLSVGSNRSQTSLGNNSFSQQSFNDSIASTSVKGAGGMGRGFENTSSLSSGIAAQQGSTTDNRTVLSQVPESTKSSLNQNSHGGGGASSISHKSGKVAHGKSTKDDHTSGKTRRHSISKDESSQPDPTLQFPFGVPADVKELMRVIKDKEAVLIKKEAELESEIKKRIKEYIRDHGIGVPKGKGLNGEQDGMMSGGSSQLNTERNPNRLPPGMLSKAPSQMTFRRDDDNSTIDSSSMPFGGNHSGINRNNGLEGLKTTSSESNGSPSRNAKSAPPTRSMDNNFGSITKNTTKSNEEKRPKSHGGGYSSLRNPAQQTPGASNGNRPNFGPLLAPLDAASIKSRLNIDLDDPNKDKIFDIIDIIVNNINYRHSSDATGKSLDSIDLIKIVTPTIPIRQDAACDTSDLTTATRPLKTLPIYDHPVDFFMTRTYKITPELESLWAKMQASDNVIAFLLNEFLPFLSYTERMRLNFAALPYPHRLSEEEMSKRPSSASAMSPSRGQLQPRSREWFTLSEEIVKGMIIIHQECMAMLPLMSAIEKISEDVIHFVKSMRKAGIPYIEDIRTLMSHHPENIGLLQRSLIDLYRLFGDLQAREISNHVRMYEYRAFFERVQIQGERSLKELFRDFPGYENAFSAFTQCQGFVFEIHKRLLECRDRCQRYEIFRLMVLSQQQLSHQLSQATGSSVVENADEINRSQQPSLSEALLRSGIISNHQQGQLNAMVSEFIQGGNPSDRQRIGPGEGRHPHESIEAYCQRLEEELKKCDEDIENLEIDVLHLMKEQDRTPPAILFYSLLHDPSFVPNLQQLSLQFHQLKGFVNQTIDMDFMLLRKRLQVCLTILPSVDKLIDKYATLHKRWAQQRLNFFAEKKLRGSAADNMSTCPLCYHELMSPSSIVPASVLPENQMQEGARAATSQSRTRTKFKALTAAAAANKQ